MTHLFPDLPEGLLQTLGELVPEFTLVGSFARDYWVHTIAGLPRGTRTLDVTSRSSSPPSTPTERSWSALTARTQPGSGSW